MQSESFHVSIVDNAMGWLCFCMVVNPPNSPDPFLDVYQSRKDRSAASENAVRISVRKAHKYPSHLCVILMAHTDAPEKTHRRESTVTHALLHKHIHIHRHTHTPPHSSKVHLSRWQLDACWGGVGQAESLAWLVGARTSWETFWHTFSGCSGTMYVSVYPWASVSLCFMCIYMWVCNFANHPAAAAAAAAAWQGPAPLQCLPVLGRGRLGREQPILSGIQSTSNMHTAPTSTNNTFPPSPLHSHLGSYTSVYLVIPPKCLSLWAGRNVLYAFPSKYRFSCVHWKCVSAKK